MAANKKIAILGATGPTGVQVVSQALQHGYEVVAFVRDPAKLAELVPSSERLQVIKGNIFSTDELASVFSGCSAVLSALGYKGFGKNTFYEDSGRCIVEAMQRSGVKRLVAVTAWYTQPSMHEPFSMKHFVKPLFLGRIMESMGRMELDLAQKCIDGAGIDYTVVRPPRLINAPVTQKAFLTEQDNVCVLKCDAHHMARADVARFMLNVLENSLFVKKAVAVIAQ